MFSCWCGIFFSVTYAGLPPIDWELPRRKKIRHFFSRRPPTKLPRTSHIYLTHSHWKPSSSFSKQCQTAALYYIGIYTWVHAKSWINERSIFDEGPNYVPRFMAFLVKNKMMQSFSADDPYQEHFILIFLVHELLAVSIKRRAHPID